MKMKRYKTKPKYVEACQFTGTRENFLEMQEWLGSDRFYRMSQKTPILVVGDE